MATSVSIAVTLDDKGVVTGVKNINSSIDQMGSGLQKTGQSGNVVFTELTNQQHKAREAALLLVEATGVQLPRALDRVFAKVPGLQGALASLFSVGAVLLFFGAIVKGVNDFDALKVKIREAGFELALFGDHVRDIVGLGDTSIIIGEQVKKQQALLKPLFDLQNQAADKAALASKTGFGAIAEQGKQSVAAIRATADAQLQAAQKQISDDKELGLVRSMIAQQAEVAIRDARKETNAQFSALAREQMNAAKKDADQLTLINLEGSGKILQEERNTDAEIDRLRKQGSVSETVAQAQRVNAHFKAQQDIYKLYQDYREQTDKMNDDTAISTVKGFQQIATEAARRKDEAEHEFDKLFGSLAENDNRRIAAQKALQDRLTDIDAAAEAKRLDLIRQNADETIQLQEKAANAALPAWARATAQIRTDYTDSIRAIDQKLHDHTITEEDAQKQRAAFWRETNAKLVDEHKRVVDQMAGQLESLFSGNIAQNILSLVKKFAFRIVAEFLTHFSALQNGFGGIFQKLFGGGGGIASGGSGGGFSLGSLLGLGGSSSGGGAAVTGSGVNQSFIGSLGLGGSSSSGFSLASLGGLAVGGAMLGIGALFSSAIGSILTPEPSKDQIAATVLQADQASIGGLQGLIQAVRDGKIADFSAMQKIQYAWGMAHNKEAYFNPGQVGDLDRSFQALLDQVKDAEIDHKRTFNPGYATGAAQFHDGGFTGNASMRLSSNEIHAILRDDEFVVNPRATRMHRGTLERMNDGSYAGGGHTFVIQTLDPRTMEHWLRTGGAEMIAKGLSLHISEGGPRRG